MTTKADLHRLIDQLPEEDTEKVFSLIAPLLELTTEGYRKGSPQALSAALKTIPSCVPEDADELWRIVKMECRRPVTDYRGIFDDLIDEEEA